MCLVVCGGLGEKTEVRPLNRATQSIRQTGSSIKPLSILIPAIAKKIITARREYKLNFDTLKKLGVVLKRARYFITCKRKIL